MFFVSSHSTFIYSVLQCQQWFLVFFYGYGKNLKTCGVLEIPLKSITVDSYEISQVSNCFFFVEVISLGIKENLSQINFQLLFSFVLTLAFFKKHVSFWVDVV